MRYLGKTVTVWSDAGELVTGTVYYETITTITVETLTGRIVGGLKSQIKSTVDDGELICAI